MKILVSGSSGLVGRALLEALPAAGHTGIRLVRSQPAHGQQPGEVRWNPLGAGTDLAGMDGADALIHLAGASIGEGRWTPARKALLRSSRIDATRHLVRCLAQLPHPPRVLICASGVGYYGDPGSEVLTEANPAGEDFPARLCRDWEAAAAAAEPLGIRTVMPRFGLILDAHGGSLPRMLTPFRLGLGGRLGSGRQWMSWITLADAVRVLLFALERGDLRGPCNAVAPEAVTNADFTRCLARILRRPAVLAVPAWALRLALGEMAGALLLASKRAVPERLQALGFAFRHPALETALRSVLAPPR